MSGDISALWRHLFGQQSEQQQAQPAPPATQQQPAQQQQGQQDTQQVPPQPPPQQQQQQQQQQQRVPTVLVGHSMGGALAVHAGSGKQIAGLEGVVVVDVVEGTALGECPA
jgi:predicted alpha/beta hydrolase family esterase